MIDNLFYIIYSILHGYEFVIRGEIFRIPQMIPKILKKGFKDKTYFLTELYFWSWRWVNISGHFAILWRPKP